MRTVLLFASVVLAACGQACPSSSELVARIEALRSGERIDLGACVVSEALEIPAGATVEGGTFELPDGAAVSLAPSPEGAPATTLRGATVRGGFRENAARIRIAGKGLARIEDGVLEVDGGIGIGVVAARVDVDGVQLTGNFDPSRVLELPVHAALDGLATYGIAAIGGAHVTLTGGTIERFVSAAAGCIGSTIELDGTAIAENRGFGIQAFDCTLGLSGVSVHDTVSAPGLPGIGIVADMGTQLTATQLELRDAPGYGLFVSASNAELDAPRIERMRQAGVWAENGATLSITGGMLDGNAGAAIAAVGATRLDVRETSVVATSEAPIPSPGGGGADTMADAIHVAQLAGTPCTVVLSDLTLSHNDRVGLVLDGAMEPLAVAIERTRIETSGTELGAVAQNVADLAEEWDVGITRVGSAATLDRTAAALTVSTGSDLVGILMPPTISF